MIARERGLAPLAEAIIEQRIDARQNLAAPFVDPALGVLSTDDALAGARDIVAEIIAEDADVRGDLRHFYAKSAVLMARLVAPELDLARTYEQYYAFQQPVSSIPPYRILAVNRGERAGALRVAVEVDEAAGQATIARYYTVDDRSPLAGDLRTAIGDSLDRLVGPALVREVRSQLTERAEQHAIGVFATNLRPLLLQAPLRGRVVIGLDPGYRSGCKVAVVDAVGRLVAGTTIYPHAPQKRWSEAISVLSGLVRTHKATVFAVGNGTASRETEELVAEVIRELALPDLSYTLVDEAGASVYSVSEVAREEFPQLEATERGVISIARRLQDPLAELVKVEPQAVGVGLYQHDLDQKELASAVDRVVVSAVTFAGVDVNTASAPLLSRVSGLTRKTAAAIVRYREEHGQFRSRRELLKVPGLGPRAFEQSAGFLRIHNSTEILDSTFVHPESYAACRRLIDFLPAGPSGDSLATRANRFASEIAAETGAFSALCVDAWDRRAHPARYACRPVPARSRSPREDASPAASNGHIVDRGSTRRDGPPGHRPECRGLRCVRGYRVETCRPRACIRNGRSLRQFTL